MYEKNCIFAFLKNKKHINLTLNHLSVFQLSS